MTKNSLIQKKSRNDTKSHQIESDQDIENPQVWGKERKNYYQEGDEEYSSVSEEQQEAHHIYQNQHRLLNDPSYYVNARDEESVVSASEELSSQVQGFQSIEKEQIIEEIKWALECQRHMEKCHSEASNESLLTLYKKLVDIYLVITISLKEFKVPYVQHHPMVQELANVKQQLSKVRRKVQLNEKIYLSAADANNQSFRKTKPIHQLNHNRIERRKSEGKSKSEAIKLISNAKIEKKPKFEIVKENEARLASEMILKNKGLMKKRKKTDGNSRLKLRKRFEKAQSKQRALGHFIRENPGRGYEGQTNIRYGKIASVKLK